MGEPIKAIEWIKSYMDSANDRRSYYGSPPYNYPELTLAIESLELMIRKEAVKVKEVSEDVKIGYCPNCDHYLIVGWRHCPHCGQAIKWPKEEK